MKRYIAILAALLAAVALIAGCSAVKIPAGSVAAVSGNSKSQDQAPDVSGATMLAVSYDNAEPITVTDAVSIKQVVDALKAPAADKPATDKPAAAGETGTMFFITFIKDGDSLGTLWIIAADNGKMPQQMRWDNQSAYSPVSMEAAKAIQPLLLKVQ